jgi:hypothetical protein
MAFKDVEEFPHAINFYLRSARAGLAFLSRRISENNLRIFTYNLRRTIWGMVRRDFGVTPRLFLKKNHFPEGRGEANKQIERRRAQEQTNRTISLDRRAMI